MDSEPLSPIKSPPTPLFGSPLHSSQSNFPIIAIAIIGILATALLLVSYYIFVIKCCLNWHQIDLLRRFSISRNRRVQDPLTVHSPVIENRGLDEAAIRSIPIFKFKKEKSKNSFECAICLNKFLEEETIRVIPNCSHIFHIDCIDVWLQNNANCPLCRTSITQILDPIRPVQDPNLYTDYFTGRDEDYVVIEIRSEHDSNEVLSVSPSPRITRNRVKKLSHVLSMGDECIVDNRKKDEQFEVHSIRRSFSMDSAADRQLYLAVQDVVHKEITNEVSPSEGCSSSSSRVKRSFFSFGHGRSSRNLSAVQPVALEP
ncbi:hypothetical protein RD792_017472 [Penstemon davidsonii]|uniref:RING-type E3 ubiquitin transferase n=1 Tax=Penstemon davidsonii TaxID=160366 RepID=A0ABR0CM38_9LAMI|nr:hypothetical protein RD792_017472 [Penstemon davidsonii]